MYNKTVTLFRYENGEWNACTVSGVQCINYSELTDGISYSHSKMYFVPGRYRTASATLSANAGDMVCAGSHTDYLPSPENHSDTHYISKVSRFPLTPADGEVIIIKT